MACQTDCSGQSLTSPHHLTFLQLQLGLQNDIWLLAKTLFVNKKSNCHVVSFILAQSGRPTLKWSDCMQESRHDPRRAEGSLPSHSCWGAGISLGGQLCHARGRHHHLHCCLHLCPLSQTPLQLLRRWRGGGGGGGGGGWREKEKVIPISPVMDIAIVYLHIATADPFKHSFIYYR